MSLGVKVLLVWLAVSVGPAAFGVVLAVVRDRFERRIPLVTNGFMHALANGGAERLQAERLREGAR